MKRIFPYAVIAVLTISCSLSMEEVFLIPGPTPTSTPSNTMVAAEDPTRTPTLLTATYTRTPTLAGQKTHTPAPDFSPTAETMTPLVLLTPNTSTPAVEMSGFIKVSASEKDFFKPGICSPASVKFTAQVSNPAGTGYVVLFVRFKSKQTGTTSEWTSITMQNLGAGTFVHELSAVEMKGEGSFRDSWVQYQFVATDSKTREIGRTGVFSDRLSVFECEPTPTSLIPPPPTVPVP